MLGERIMGTRSPKEKTWVGLSENDRGRSGVYGLDGT